MNPTGARRSRRFNYRISWAFGWRSGLKAALRCFIFIGSLLVSSHAAEPANFDAANRLYEKGDYAGAIVAYQNLSAQGKSSAALLFNLGNAHFKSGQVGRAILAYRKAEAVAPRDPDIRANLHFARGSVPGNNLRVTAVDRLLQILSLNELGALAAGAFWAWFLLLAVAQWRPTLKTPLRIYIVAAGIFTVLFSVWLAQAALDRAGDRAAVVIVPTSAVRFGPLEESQISFNARDGNELRIIGQKDAWLQVSDPSNRTGWILTNDVARLK